MVVGGSIGGRYLSDESLFDGGKTAAAETAKDSSKISSDEAIVALDEFFSQSGQEDNQEQHIYMKVNLSILVAMRKKARKLRKMLAVHS